MAREEERILKDYEVVQDLRRRTIENADYCGTGFKSNVEVFLNKLKYVENWELLAHSPLVGKVLAEIAEFFVFSGFLSFFFEGGVWCG